MMIYLQPDVELEWLVRALQDEGMDIYACADGVIDFVVPMEERN